VSIDYSSEGKSETTIRRRAERRGYALHREGESFTVTAPARRQRLRNGSFGGSLAHAAALIDVAQRAKIDEEFVKTMERVHVQTHTR
jgi:hypothetical protein